LRASDCAKDFNTPDEEYLQGSLALLRKGFSALFCILRGAESDSCAFESLNYVDQTSVSDATAFDSYYNKSDGIKSTTTSDIYDNHKLQGDIYPGGDIILQNDVGPITMGEAPQWWWYKADQIGNCVATHPKYEFNTIETVSCFVQTMENHDFFCSKTEGASYKILDSVEVTLSKVVKTETNNGEYFDKNVVCSLNK